MFRIFFLFVIIALFKPHLAQTDMGKDDHLPSDLLQIADTKNFSKYVFLVDKKERKLFVYERNGTNIQKISEYTADIGKNDGDKKRENDHKTPEGIYFFQEKLTQPQIPFNLYGKMAFTTDYPNFFDRLESKTGSGIWLHSIPDSVPLTRGSRGCVVVRNENLDQIQSWIDLKQTPIIIFDKIEFSPPEEHAAKKNEIKNWILSWKQAWESKSIENYMAFYSEQFKSKEFADIKKWKNHKQRLFKLYSSISLHLDQPYILRHKDQLIIKVLQKFTSDKHSDYGVKTIHAKKINDQFKIISEQWIRSDSQGTTLETDNSLGLDKVEAPSAELSTSENQTVSGHQKPD